MSCTSDEGARLPEDQLPIDHGGRRYWCHVVVDTQMVPGASRPPASCRVDRAAVRTLSDRAAGSVRPAVTVTTVSALAAFPPPRSFASRGSGAERTRYRVRARLVSATRGPASELRLVLADRATNETIAVIFPAAACTAGAAPSSRRSIASARAAFTDSCGAVTPGAPVRLAGMATVSGVGFFARSRPASGNGFALAPALSFSADDCRRVGG